MLRPGMSVLDVGCGTGSITYGIAKAVGDSGRVVGVDRDATLIEGLQEHHSLPSLEFVLGDATSLIYRAEFDIATAARTLQWIDDPAAALAKMKDAVKPGGAIVILDYNHVSNSWEPDPPAAFRTFYQGFLAWRDSHHWDNQMAEHLPDLMRAAGLTQIEVHNQDEVIGRDDPDHQRHFDVWGYVIEVPGDRIVSGGFLMPDQLRAAADAFKPWAATELMKQTMVLRAVVARVPE